MPPSLVPLSVIAPIGIQGDELEKNHPQMPEVQKPQAQPMPIDIEEKEINPAPMQVSPPTPVQPKGSTGPHVPQAQSP